MRELLPRLHVPPQARRRLWEELCAVPDGLTPYGATAPALHLGHRTSVDFDFFGSRAIDLAALEGGLALLVGAEIIQRERNSLTVAVDRGAAVNVSFFWSARAGASGSAPRRKRQWS